MLAAAVAVACFGAPAKATAQAPYILNGMYLAIGPDLHFNDVNGDIWLWQGRSFAILNFFAGDPSLIKAEMEDIWNNQHSVPMVSYAPPTPNSSAAAGQHDLHPWGTLVRHMRDFLAGPDGVLGNWDDRRAYMRFGWEFNHSGMAWSPCREPDNPNAAQDFIRSWRRLHDMFTAAGVTNTRLAWVFSIATVDACPAGAPENTYPGSAYVDWFGIDAYANCPGLTAAQVITPYMNRLRGIDSSKPLGINEAGVSSYLGIAEKNQWISDYFAFLRENDIRMSIWFNSDKGSSTSCADWEKPWAVYGLNHGDESRTDVFGITWRGFSAYRAAVNQPWIVGNDESPRRISDQHFLGQ